MRTKFILSLLVCTTVILSFNGCKKEGGLNFFSIEDDKNFGAQVEAEINNDTTHYHILSRATH